MLQDKVVLITGGAGLLGKEFVSAIVENRGAVIIGDIDPDAVGKIQAEIEQKSDAAKVEFVLLDINSMESVQNAISRADKRYGRIDAWVNSAYPKNEKFGRHFFDVEHSDFCENLRIHLGGYFLCSQQILKYFLKQGYGNLVNVASIYGVIAPRFEIYESTDMTLPVEYATIKSGLIHLTKYMAKYVKGKNIRVNAISPGGILDNQPEAFVEKYNCLALNKGMLGGRDIAGTLVFLLSDFSKFINGQNIIVDDGFTL